MLSTEAGSETSQWWAVTLGTRKMPSFLYEANFARSYVSALGLSFLDCSTMALADASASSSVRLVSVYGVVTGAGERTVQIDNSNVRTAGNKTLGHDKAQASSTACDHTYSSLEGELRKCSLQMRTSSTLNWWLGRKLLCRFRVLHDDAVVCSSLRTFMIKAWSAQSC